MSKRKSEELDGNEKKKRPVACLRCRKQKLKCIFTDDTICVRCKSQNRPCIVESRIDENDWKKQTDQRLGSLETSINRLIQLLEPSQVIRNDASFFDVDYEETISTRPQKMLNESEVKEILAFFNNNLSKYLPIFIFDYIPQINRQIESVSTVLFSAILSVTTLYLPPYQHHHNLLIAYFKDIVEQLSPATIFDASGKPNNFMKVIHDMLGCIIAAAWLGNDIGARCCIIASDLAGRLNPQILDDLDIDDTSKRAAFAFSLTSYIIEKRLQISYTKSEFLNMNNEMSANRDYFLPLYLNQMFVQVRNDHPNATEYKVNANVELCAITMLFQKELGKNRKDIYEEIITTWSGKLNTWLADWIGKLTTHLDASSLKPLILAFNFAKLFVNVQAINSIGSGTNNVDSLLTRSENTSLDIIEMLLIDKDIRRLIRMGPIFYPTIFVTAAALLLKIVTIAPKYNYKVNSRHLVDNSKKAFEVLSTCIVSPSMPSYATIKTLGDGIKKVSKKLSDATNVPDPILNVGSTESLSESFTAPKDVVDPIIAPNVPVMDYREIWATEIFNDNFSWDGFNADLMKSIHESPSNLEM